MSKCANKQFHVHEDGPSLAVSTHMWTVTPFSRRSLTRRTDEMTSRPKLSKTSTFHSASDGIGMAWSAWADDGSGF